ncbi:hypothetical protein SASPL_130070 [Salvia splendens]|uniref:Isopenicillin N synthase-like Fe(2+) 2OG dioxygenase domain-containing protein n=1 Tax=Salvia splendens TaxID=180675 RepID=A0A8X8X7F3_SALSN|nr:hypothetical protein SASPL_130070 [Salvia splendens]
MGNTNGFLVLREGARRWTTVPPHLGALVVHVGDLMHILSNGSYPSVLHRAKVNRTRHRLSVAYLYNKLTMTKDGNGETPLQVLARKPLAFSHENGQGIGNKIIRSG